MLFIAEVLVELLRALKVVLFAVLILVILPAMGVLVHDEIQERKTTHSGRHRPSPTSNSLAAQFLMERRERETNEYKIFHPAVAGKRA